MVSALEQMQVPNGTGPVVKRRKRPLLASLFYGNLLESGNNCKVGNGQKVT